MAEIVWLLEETVIAIHHRQIAEHGGSGGLRDEGSLSSAVARPQNLLSYGQPPLIWQPWPLLMPYGIARDHPFVDGNKRTALVATRTFLLLNGVDLNASQDEKYRTLLQLAQGSLTEEQLGDWIRKRI
jgi:death-on-curing protein